MSELVKRGATLCSLGSGRDAERSAPAAFLRAVAEIALAGLMFVFVRSPGKVNIQHRVLFVLLALSLPVAAWSVFRSRLQLPGWRLWLIGAAGFLLSLAVKGESLTRPPSLPAAYCAITAGAAALLSAAWAWKSFRAAGLEGGMAASVLVLVAAMGILFRPVASQNSLDAEVLHNTLGILLDYAMLICGVTILSSERRSFVRMAALMSIACLVKLVWQHAVPAG